MPIIKITVADLAVTAELNDSATAGKIIDNLPLRGIVNLWGEEIYFDIPVQIDLASDAVADVQVGTLAYWPMGSAFCIFFGPTPASTGPAPRAYSPVNVFGRIREDPAILKTVHDGAEITIELVD